MFISKYCDPGKMKIIRKTAPGKIHLRIVFILFVLHFTGLVDSLKSLQIYVPKAVISGGSAELVCTYDLEGAQLYSIRWYMGMVEFYRYVPKESPATKVFPVSDIKVDVAQSDQHKVHLRDVYKDLTGEYQCEVSADAPLFHTGIQSAGMTVVEAPSLPPNITVDKMQYSAGDRIIANCTSYPSLPAANITWFVNEQKVPGYTVNEVTQIDEEYFVTSATLELEAAHLAPAPALSLRCESSLFDVWSASSEVLRLREKSDKEASALGRSSSGSRENIWRLAALPAVSVIMVLIVQNLCSNTSTR